MTIRPISQRSLAQDKSAHRSGRPRRATPGRAYFVMKRIIDLTLTIGAAPIWLPVLGACALAIKIESRRDPVFYHQQRTGRDGRRFEMFKLRTMVVGADALKRELRETSERKWPDFKMTDDPRVTRVGGFLRRTSLDEIPQLFNVLRGEMSLVGPRPTSFGSETYAIWQTQRLEAIPGITGLWQVEGRGDTEFDERLRLDIAYLESRSTLGDLSLLWRTIAVVLERRGGA